MFILVLYLGQMLNQLKLPPNGRSGALIGGRRPRYYPILLYLNQLELYPGFAMMCPTNQSSPTVQRGARLVSRRKLREVA